MTTQPPLPLEPRRYIVPRPPLAGTTVDFVIVVFATLISTALLLSIVGVGLLIITNPDSSTISVLINVLADIMTTILGALIGFIAGKGQGEVTAARADAVAARSEAQAVSQAVRGNPGA